MKKIKVYVLLLLILSLMTGCWDKVEIEDRAFVMAIGIDTSNQAKNYIVTFQFPNVKQVTSAAGGGGGGGGQPNFSISEVGDTVFSASRHVSTRLDKRLFLGHTKAVILGKDVVSNRDKFLEVLDTLDRSYELSRKLRLLVAEGKAQDILLKNYKFDPDIGVYIDDIFKQYNRTSIFPNIDYNKITKSLHDTNGNAIIPVISSGKDELKIAGSAIIKDYKLAGWLSDGENMGYMWLMGFVKGGDITFNMPTTDGKEVKVPFNITNTVMKRQVAEQDGKIIYKIKYDVEGEVTEYSFQKHGEMFDTNVLGTMENKANKVIEKMINDSLKRFQKDLKVDMVGVGDYIQKYKPGLWSKVGSEWKTRFPDVVVEPVVSTHIRRIGLFK
ncbi:Ger(x)C family spore germination protein [Thermoanaerobacterium thermosaccharolyticum]